MPSAITIRAAPFTSAARISNRKRPNVRSAVTGRCASVIEEEGRRWIHAADAFADFPIAFLETA